MDKTTHQIRREQWTQIINNCLESGQSKKAWCRDNGICEKSFYYWQRILRNEAYIEMKQFPERPTIPKQPELPVAFVELKPTVEETEQTLTFRPDIVLRRGQFVLEISNTVSLELLKYLGGLLSAQ